MEAEVDRLAAKPLGAADAVLSEIQETLTESG